MTQVDVEGADPTQTRLRVSVDGRSILVVKGFDHIQVLGARVEMVDEGPLYKARLLSEASCSGVAGGGGAAVATDFPARGDEEAPSAVETVVEACTEEKDSSCAFQRTVVDLARFDPSKLVFYVARWHGCEELAGYPERLVLANIGYDGGAFDEEEEQRCWDSAEGCQGGAARLVAAANSSYGKGGNLPPDIFIEDITQTTSHPV
jgi:hypothetical protein